MWPFDNSFYEEISARFETLLKDGEDAGNTNDLSALLAPVDPFNRSPLFTPVVKALGVAALVAMTGLAAAGLVVAFVAFLGLYFLLTEVFGYELSLAPLQPM